MRPPHSAGTDQSLAVRLCHRRVNPGYSSRVESTSRRKIENRLIHDLDTSREGMDDNAPLKMLRPWKGVWRPIWSRREELGGFSFLISIFVGMFSIGAPYFISNNIVKALPQQCGIPRLPWIGASVINWSGSFPTSPSTCSTP